MSEEVTQLTPEQEAQLPVYRDKWINIGLSTDKIREEKAIQAVRKLYECGDLTPPENIRVFDSPKAIMDHLKTIPDFKDSSNSDLLNMFVFGQHDAAWLSYYDYLQQEVLNEPPGKLEGLILCAEECGWVVPLKNHCFVAQKTERIQYNAEGQVHAEKSPAISYPDGWGAAVLWGQQVPLSWLTNPPSPSEMLVWPNADQRQAGCNLLGWDRILDELDTEYLDKNDNPQIGNLLKVRMTDPEDSSESSDELFAEFWCGTGRRFAQMVTPSNAKTAQEAQNWMHDMPEGVDYSPAWRQ